MKKQIIFTVIQLTISAFLFAQDRLPSNPTPGKCYIRTVAAETYNIHEETYPVFTGGEINPSALDTIVLTLCPASTHWGYKSSMENCRSNDPKDCMTLCLIDYPEETVELVVVKDPEKYGNAEFQTFEIKEIDNVGGEISWEEIECTLTNYNNLPILFYPNDIELREQDKNIIDSELLELMEEKPNIRIEISSHTDARGYAEINRDLSEDRAEAVIDHLVSKGVQRSRLLAKGYGEERLKNHCKDGIDCTEQEHAENERTEFRVISN